MPPTPPSTTSSSAGQSPPDAQFRVVRKRNRVPLSCGPCRHRKLKCNRGHPCDNCTKRGDSGSCTYATPGSRKKSSSSTGASTSPDDMQNRIDRLEGLVLSLMTNGPQSAGTAAAQAAIANSMSNGSSADHPYDLVNEPEMIKEEDDGDESEVEQVAKSIGVMKVDNNRAVFASEAHWYAILGEISEVKNYFHEHKKQYEEQLKRYKATRGDELSPGTAFLFGAQKPTSQAEILSRFPAKPTADILVSRYFNTYDPGIHIIHGPTFQKQYDKHWLNPNETPVIWLGLVYAMMCIALQSYSRAGDEPPEYKGKSWEMSSEYRSLTAQCLIMADITQPITDMLETLVLHIYADYARSRDAEAGILISTGIIVRLAMRMGLHRDSAPYAGISVFQGEMRRRVWAAIRSLDLLFSAQAGLPPIVRPRDSNTEIPRNIYDDELFEEMKVLPPSRPTTELTPTLFLINRTRLIYKLGEAVEATDSLTCSSYEVIMKLDQEARELHESISPHLKPRSMDESVRDPSNLIMQRFTLELLYLKIVMVLHRKFLSASRTISRFTYSRRVCIDASMTMLQHQATLHRECQPGGRLRGVKWFISSLTTVDFLLAAMIICSDLYHTARAERQGRSQPGEHLWTHDRRDEMLDAMETAVGIWEGLKDQSMEAYKAHATLSVMLQQLKQHQATRQAQQNFSSSSSSVFAAPSPMDDSNVAPEHSAAMTLGMLSTGGLTPSSANMFDTRYPASISNLLNDPVPQQASSGLTPNYNGMTSAPESVPSPFSNLFGTSIGFQSLDLPSTDNIDWNAWDSYIQGPNLDATNSFFPMDISSMPMQTDSGVLPGAQSGSHLNGNSNPTNAFPGTAGVNGGVFMGVSTYPAMNFASRGSDIDQADAKQTSSEQGYAMGFMIPKAT
ncbi:fungal-specific transcription factor domain-domain-containing protein [Clohesyomyces aquaticus]|uniref:Fungal-specific transcription factor domain-domain-containing protein n=1 Tax=Clohesyomyces aquaticus TaxID=1231657 RepID=A0A1Y1ZWF0_9PLEO|nr:fungal-specific transcription factor domain-domain-containing protein [Clohesyomyces aquaticus]